MHIDPSAWMFIIPVVIVALWLYSQPPDHVVKRGWRELRRCEALGWERLGVVTGDTDMNVINRADAMLFWTAVSALSFVSLASFAAYLGVL